MAISRILNTRFQLLCDSTANWELYGEKVLLKGEIGIELLDNNKAKLKVGTGELAWKDLPYFGGETDLDNLEETLETLKAQTQALAEKDATLENELTALREVVGHSATADLAATGLFATLDTKANKDDVYTKEEVNGLVSGVYHLKGSVDNYSDLPTAGMHIGDVYNIKNADFTHGIMPGDNVAWTEAGWDKLSGIVDLSNYVTFTDLNALKEIVDATYLTKEYFEEVAVTDDYKLVSLPKGTIVGWYDKEIRVMCPVDTEWKLQPGNNGDQSMYYFGLKIYAPNKDVVSFKEDFGDIIMDNTMYYFEDNDFAGIDPNGRKYSIIWLAAAQVDGEGNWSYFGTKSTKERYMGWTYNVEWYDANGVKVGADMKRINLSNEDCHNTVEPYYAATVNVNKLVQTPGDSLILNGGNASE